MAEPRILQREPNGREKIVDLDKSLKIIEEEAINFRKKLYEN